MSITSNSELEFQLLALAPELLSVVAELGFTQMTPIQAQAIPVMLAGSDLIAQSQTGSGKTAAFALPILQKIDLRHRQIQAVVICPTRELVTQVVGDIRKLGRALPGLQILSLTGGQPGRAQAESLAAGVHLIVGTPGRILDHITRGRIDLESVVTVILDEADKMLDMGFEDEIKAVMEAMPRQSSRDLLQARQTALFSATFPETIQNLSRRYQKNPTKITIAETAGSKPEIAQFLYESLPEEKINTLMRVLQQHPSKSTVIFCNQKVTVAEVGEVLGRGHVSSAALHGDLEQRDRDRVMAMFRNGSHRILIATDVAARGLDIENLEMVVNLDLPAQPEVYVHRIGRTGRAGRVGTAVTITKPNDELKIQAIEKLTGVKMQRKSLGFKNQHGLGGAYQSASMQTLSIAGGRKDKLRPGDILGALTAAGAESQVALKSGDIGKIEIHDRFSYVAVASGVATVALEKLREGRIKGNKYQVRFMK